MEKFLARSDFRYRIEVQSEQEEEEDEENRSNPNLPEGSFTTNKRPKGNNKARVATQ